MTRNRSAIPTPRVALPSSPARIFSLSRTSFDRPPRAESSIEYQRKGSSTIVRPHSPISLRQEG
ncbi:uncharacterized protein BDW43DRAFT_274702 [Aspergillus alliaceus]|uniref:uncharacterized protein n=1 Tax=Petromyces alliaceus TaxID=209559 RepID=UPI0012A578A9|nr:uncharacterized protein BDW43DRAFT_274702 [Aspergillus alliaceus]KAB8233959.1 hypothetical protein BDW43DRAFT_274702 [Aspergillus alliaceus]